MLLGFIFVLMCAIYLLILKITIELFFIALLKINLYLFKKRCDRFLKYAIQGMCYREELEIWLDIEEKMYKKRQERIEELYQGFSFKKHIE